MEEQEIFDQYSDYEKVESHLEMSKTLFFIDKKGQHILSELQEKKVNNKKKKTFTEEVGRIYTTLIDVLNVKKLTPRLFCDLLHVLDELVFKEVAEYEHFYIEDEQYELTKIYFGQSTWICDQDIQHYKFMEFTYIDVNEAMYLTCYLREYENFLLTIEEYITDLNCDLKRRISQTIGRIRRKLKIIWDILVVIISEGIEKEGNNEAIMKKN